MTSLTLFLTLPYLFYFVKASPWSKLCVNSISRSRSMGSFAYIRFSKNPEKFTFNFNQHVTTGPIN